MCKVNRDTGSQLHIAQGLRVILASAVINDQALKSKCRLGVVMSPKQTSKNDRPRGYVMTQNNPTEEQIAMWQSIPDRLNLKLGICAEEYGSENGHHHLHTS